MLLQDLFSKKYGKIKDVLTLKCLPTEERIDHSIPKLTYEWYK